MIQTIQKVIRIGSSAGVTLPAKELKRQNLKVGDDVEIFINPAKTKGNYVDPLKYANRILREYRKDFINLAKK